MKIEQQEQILACMAEVLNQNGFRAEVMRKEGAPTLLRWWAGPTRGLDRKE